MRWCNRPYLLFSAVQTLFGHPTDDQQVNQVETLADTTYRPSPTWYKPSQETKFESRLQPRKSAPNLKQARHKNIDIPEDYQYYPGPAADSSPIPPVPPLPQSLRSPKLNLPIRPHTPSDYTSRNPARPTISSLEEADYEYKYTQLLIDRLWDHLLQREEDESVRILLLNERQNLDRLVKFRRSVR